MTTFGFDDKTEGLIVSLKVPLDSGSMIVLNWVMSAYDFTDIKFEKGRLNIYNMDLSHETTLAQAWDEGYEACGYDAANNTSDLNPYLL